MEVVSLQADNVVSPAVLWFFVLPAGYSLSFGNKRIIVHCIWGVQKVQNNSHTTVSHTLLHKQSNKYFQFSIKTLELYLIFDRHHRTFVEQTSDAQLHQLVNSEEHMNVWVLFISPLLVNSNLSHAPIAILLSFKQNLMHVVVL